MSRIAPSTGRTFSRPYDRRSGFVDACVENRRAQAVSARCTRSWLQQRILGAGKCLAAFAVVWLATVGVASRLKADGKVAIGICAVAPTPLRLFALEDKINQRGISEETILWAAEEIKEQIKPISDVRSSAAYRLAMASALLKRGLLSLIS